MDSSCTLVMGMDRVVSRTATLKNWWTNPHLLSCWALVHQLFSWDVIVGHSNQCGVNVSYLNLMASHFHISAQVLLASLATSGTSLTKI